MKRSQIVLAGLLLAFITVLTGCGSSGGSDDVASTGNGSAATSQGSPSGKGGKADLVKYARCLRKNGLDVADPQNGRFNLKIDKSQAEVAKKAMEVCRSLAPSSDASNKKEASARGLKFAQCMRKHGVEKFKDPDSSGAIRIDGSVQDDPDFAKAQKTCGSIMDSGPSLTSKGR